MKHIPTRYFTASFNMSERWAIIDKYEDPVWDKAKNYTEARQISKSAIEIADRVEVQLDIKLFPLITRIASKGWNIGGGTFAFSMTDIDGEIYYFDTQAKHYKSKKRSLYVDYSDNVIGLNSIKK